MEKNYTIVEKTVQNPDKLIEEFIGKWKFVRKENFDEFLKACGIGYIFRKAADALTPTEIIECMNNPNNYSLK
jgi:hypothetical protein